MALVILAKIINEEKSKVEGVFVEEGSKHLNPESELTRTNNKQHDTEQITCNHPHYLQPILGQHSGHVICLDQSQTRDLITRATLPPPSPGEMSQSYY